MGMDEQGLNWATAPIVYGLNFCLSIARLADEFNVYRSKFVNDPCAIETGPAPLNETPFGDLETAKTWARKYYDEEINYPPAQ